MADPKEKIAEIVGANEVVLFMKGTALFPQCGFSSRAIAILDRLGATYETVDVLQDPEIRQGVKAYSDWPTIPQLYVKGEFVGGSDIMMEMFESGELQELLPASGASGEGDHPQDGGGAPPSAAEAAATSPSLRDREE